MTTHPTITRLHGIGPAVRYRLEGGDLAPEWRSRAGRIAWCEISVWPDSGNVASYGGEVWPTAWPELFQALPSSAQLGSGGVAITEIGRQLLAAAPAAPRYQLLQDTVARPLIGDRWSVMNRQDGGLASYGVECKSLMDVVQTFAVRLGERGTDKFGEFIRLHRVSQ